MTYEMMNEPKGINEMINKPKEVEVINTPNPVYGPMGREVRPTGWDSLEMQYRQAIKPDETINVENRPSRYVYQSSKPVPVDLTPIRRMDDLR